MVTVNRHGLAAVDQ